MGLPKQMQQISSIEQSDDDVDEKEEDKFLTRNKLNHLYSLSFCAMHCVSIKI